MARGGKRPGAGRKKGTKAIQAEKYREALIKAVLKEKAPLIKALIEKGKTGDVQALKEINDRALGKAPQSIDHTTDGKELPAPILANVSSNDGD